MVMVFVVPGLLITVVNVVSGIVISVVEEVVIICWLKPMESVPRIRSERISGEKNLEKFFLLMALQYYRGCCYIKTH